MVPVPKKLTILKKFFKAKGTSANTSPLMKDAKLGWIGPSLTS